jgi:hypothetical protein
MKWLNSVGPELIWIIIFKKLQFKPGWWLTHVTLATQEAEVRRITVQS